MITERQGALRALYPPLALRTSPSVIGLSKVQGLRNRMGLVATDAEEVRNRKTLTLTDAVERLGVSNRVILRLIRNGTITATQVVPNAPYGISPESLDTPAVEAAIRRTRERGKGARAWASDRRSLSLPGFDDTASCDEE